MDALTDMLKYFLYQQPAQQVPQLVARVQQRLVTKQSASKLEKHALRCLSKNPAFDQEPQGRWLLDTRGQRSNDQLYQWLQGLGKALNIGELRSMAEDRGIDPSLLIEKDLVADGRFLRLRDGRWALVHWEVIKMVNGQELDRMAQQLRSLRQPAGVEDLAREVLGCGVEGTDLMACLQRDPRFVWVGGHHWYLRELLPSQSDSGVSRAEALEPFRKAETAVLGEAELMLILNDTDPNSRDYILSSADLERGALRVTKRMERLFSGLPPVAWVSFRTGESIQEAWYLRLGGCILGLEPWFKAEGLVPGSKLRVKRVAGEERIFELEATGEREAEVYTEGRRVQQLEALWRRDQQERMTVERLVMEVMRLFPGGLKQEEIIGAVAAIRPEAVEEVPSVLEGQPFYELTVEGTWRFNQAVQAAYERLAQETLRAREEVEQAVKQAAAASQEAQSLLVEKEGLQGELIYLQNHHRDQEAQLHEKIRRLREQNDELQRENARTRAEMEKVYRRKEQLQQELEPARQQVVALRAERESLRGKVEQLEARSLQLQSNLSRAMQEAQAEQLRLGQRLKELEGRLHQSIIANEDLQRTVVKLQEERRLLKRRLNHWLVRLAVSISSLFSRRENGY